jgi:hypothetical protein
MAYQVDPFRSAYVCRRTEKSGEWVVYDKRSALLGHLTTKGVKELCEERGVEFDGRWQYVFVR